MTQFDQNGLKTEQLLRRKDVGHCWVKGLELLLFFLQLLGRLFLKGSRPKFGKVTGSVHVDPDGLLQFNREFRGEKAGMTCVHEFLRRERHSPHCCCDADLPLLFNHVHNGTRLRVCKTASASKSYRTFAEATLLVQTA